MPRVSSFFGIVISKYWNEGGQFRRQPPLSAARVRATNSAVCGGCPPASRSLIRIAFATDPRIHTPTTATSAHLHRDAGERSSCNIEGFC